MAIALFPQIANPLKLQSGSCEYIPQNDARVLAKGDWVSLLTPPSAYAHHEALLLCQVDSDRWVTWIPDCGEVELCLRQFCHFNEQ
jgi:hypothetical protein